MEKMTEEQIVQALKGVSEWGAAGEAIQRTFQFKDFVESMAFVNKVAAQAEADQHHPDILIRWNKVTLTLSTHDASGITEKDFALAAKADAISAPMLGAKAPAPSGDAGSKKPKKA